MRDIITPANFGIDRFRGLSVARGQILGFSIGFRRRPYNTLVLPCECVIAAEVREADVAKLWWLALTWPRNCIVRGYDSGSCDGGTDGDQSPEGFADVGDDSL